MAALGEVFAPFSRTPYGVAVSAALVAGALWPFWRRASHPFVRVAAAICVAVLLTSAVDRLATEYEWINQLGFVAFAIIGPVWWLLSSIRPRRPVQTSQLP
jgi:hypothetical protein